MVRGTERGEKKDYTIRLHALAQNLGIVDQVQFLGQRQDMPELLQAAVRLRPMAGLLLAAVAQVGTMAQSHWDLKARWVREQRVRSFGT